MNDKLNSQLNCILWGRRYINVDDAKGKSSILIAKDLELKDKVWMDFVYTQALTDGKAKNLMPYSELAFFLDEAGVWTKSHEKNLSNLKTSLNKILDTLSNSQLSKREYKQSNKIKDSIKSEINKIDNRKAKLFNNTLEVFADTEKLNAALFCMLYRDEDVRFWETWDDFLKHGDKVFINNATSKIFASSRMSTKDIRKITRSTSWRIKWNAYKSSGNLFNKPLIDLTNNQESMIYWSQVYDSVYESMERPPESIINDDEALDEWFEDQSKKRKKDEVENSKSKSKIGSSQIWRHGEVGIVVGEAIEADLNRATKMGIGAKNQTTMSVEEVNNLNDPLAKKFRKHQRDKIKEHGVIEERELRSDKNSRRVIGASDVVFKKGRRADGFTTKKIIDKRPGGTL
jgi:hypothetical protein